jgi:hypothetical protein
MSIKHTTIATGTNDGTKQVSVTVWNEVHAIDTSLNLPDSTYPATAVNPASGAELFSQFLLGTWRRVGFIDTENKTTFFAAHQASTNVYSLVPNGGTSATTFATPVGHAITATVNAFLAQAPAAGSAVTLSTRYTCRTSNTAGNTADVRPTGFMGSRTGGFFFSTTFKMRTIVTNHRAFFGLINIVTALGNVNIITNTTQDKIGVGCNASTGNWQFFHNVAGTTPTTTDLGVDFALNTTDFFRLSLVCINLDTASVYWSVENLTNGQTSSGIATTNLPTVTAQLAPRQYLSNNAQSTIADFDSTGYYMEAFTV